MSVRALEYIDTPARNEPLCEVYPNPNLFGINQCGLPECHDGDHAVVSMSGLVIETFPPLACESADCGSPECGYCWRWHT